jgi:hypothetical protein
VSKRWFYWLLALVVISSLYLPASVRAQSETRLSALTIELWPEYDQPTMLVILRGTLAPETTLPTSVTVHIPASANGPHAVAVQDANGQLTDAQFVTTLQADSLAVTLQATLPSFQVEYYDAMLKIEGEARQYAFAWTADFAVTAATLRVQEPVNVRNLSGEPPLALAGTSDTGLSYYTASLGALTAGQAITAQINYTKPDAQLSLAQVTAQPPVATPVLVVTQPTAMSEAQLQQWLAMALLVVSIGLVGLGFLFWRRTRAAPTQPTRSHGRRSTNNPPPASPPAMTTKYCTQCGQPVEPEDRFCRHCGNAVRAA